MIGREGVLIAVPPLGQPWAVDDLLDLPENSRYELLEGSLIISPLETNQQVFVELGLTHQRRPQLPPAWFAERKICLRIGADSLLVPDVVVMRKSTRSDPQQLGFDPTDVALVVEVVSPTSRKRDRFLKPPAYAEAGIPAFWRLELEPEPRLLAHVLRDGAYELVAALTAHGDVEVLGVTVSLDVAALHQA